MNFLASPEIVTAMAFSGNLSFNPMKDSLIGADGEPFQFEPPTGSNLPENGFEPGMLLDRVKILVHTLRMMLIGHEGNLAYTPASSPLPLPETEVVISPASARLEALSPFPSYFASGSSLELPALEVLMRVQGKCTTDHISAAVSD